MNLALRSITASCLLALALSFVAAPAIAQALPGGIRAVTAVEGVDEYRLPNGLQLLLIPDDSKPTTTVNLTYRVGSRHENYGETTEPCRTRSKCTRATCATWQRHGADKKIGRAHV